MVLRVVSAGEVPRRIDLVDVVVAGLLVEGFDSVLSLILTVGLPVESEMGGPSLGGLLVSWRIIWVDLRRGVRFRRVV